MAVYTELLTVTTGGGGVIAAVGAPVTVYATGTQTKVTLYTDATLTTTTANPVTANSAGVVTFFCAAQTVDLSYVVNGVTYTVTKAQVSLDLATANATYVAQVEGRNSPLTRLARFRSRRAYLKNVAGPANLTDTVLVNIASGAGVVDHLWIAVAPSGGSPQYDLRLRVFTDGSATPDIDVPVGMMFGYANGPQFGSSNMASEHFYAKTNQSGVQAHGGLRLPIPFTNGVKIVLSNRIASASSSIFSQVDYTLVADNPTLTVPSYRLKSQGFGTDGYRSVAAAANKVMHAVDENAPGILVAHAMTGYSAGVVAETYLERNISVTVDQEASPSWTSSGLEDWFLASYYFSAESPYSRPAAMGLGHNAASPFYFSALVDLLSLNGGIPFTSSATVSALTNSATTGDMNYASNLLYYVQTGAAITARDSFTRPASTTTLGSAETGPAWSALRGTWGISGETAYNAGNTADSIAVLETGSTSHYLRAQWMTTNPNGSLVFGVVDADNLYLFNADVGGLYKRVAGTFTQIGTATGYTTLAVGDVMAVRKAGTTLTVYQNEKVLLSLTDSSVVGGTKCGLRADSNGTLFKNVLVA